MPLRGGSRGREPDEARIDEDDPALSEQHAARNDPLVGHLRAREDDDGVEEASQHVERALRLEGSLRERVGERERALGRGLADDRERIRLLGDGERFV